MLMRFIFDISMLMLIIFYAAAARIIFHADALLSSF